MCTYMYVCVYRVNCNCDLQYPGTYYVYYLKFYATFTCTILLLPQSFLRDLNRIGYISCQQYLSTVSSFNNADHECTQQH